MNGQRYLSHFKALEKPFPVQCLNKLNVCGISSRLTADGNYDRMLLHFFPSYFFRVVKESDPFDSARSATSSSVNRS